MVNFLSVAKLSLGLLVLAVVCLTIPQGLLVQRRRLKPQYAAQLQRPAWEPVDAALALMPPSDTRALLAYEVSRFRAVCPPRWQQTVAAYAAFHARALAEARAWVAAGAQEGPTKPKTPFIIWRCRDSPGHAYNNTVDDDCGGLGDRLAGLTHMLLYAVLSDSVMLIDWGSAQPRNGAFMAPFFDWSYDEQLLAKLGTIKR